MSRRIAATLAALRALGHAGLPCVGVAAYFAELCAVLALAAGATAGSRRTAELAEALRIAAAGAVPRAARARVDRRSELALLIHALLAELQAVLAEVAEAPALRRGEPLLADPVEVTAAERTRLRVADAGVGDELAELVGALLAELQAVLAELAKAPALRGEEARLAVAVEVAAAGWARLRVANTGIDELALLSEALLAELQAVLARVSEVPALRGGEPRLAVAVEVAAPERARLGIAYRRRRDALRALALVPGLLAVEAEAPELAALVIEDA
jgi:hypothetical protein